MVDDDLETRIVESQPPQHHDDDLAYNGPAHTSHLESQLCPGQEGLTSQIFALSHLFTALDNCYNADVREAGLRFAESLGAQAASGKSNVLTLVKG